MRAVDDAQLDREADELNACEAQEKGSLMPVVQWRPILLWMLGLVVLASVAGRALGIL